MFNLSLVGQACQFLWAMGLSWFRHSAVNRRVNMDRASTGLQVWEVKG